MALSRDQMEFLAALEKVAKADDCWISFTGFQRADRLTVTRVDIDTIFEYVPNVDAREIRVTFEVEARDIEANGADSRKEIQSGDSRIDRA